jgi:hypothetical protein
VNVSWRSSRWNDLAHVCRPGTNVTLCGSTADGPTVAAGRPCPTCLAAATEALAAEARFDRIVR